MNRLLALLLFAASAAGHAQSEIIIDNTDPGFSATGTWPASTAVSGFQGSNYQSHAPNGAPPGAVVVDNTDPGFSVTGTWPTSSSVSGYLGTNYRVHSANGEPPGAIVVDNSAGSVTGTWPNSTSVSGYFGTNYQTHAAGTGGSVFTWPVSVPSSSAYQVYARWTSHPNRATNAKYAVNHAGGPTQVQMNMELNSGQWNLLGTFSFDAGATTITLSDDANDYVIADAVMLVPPGAAPNTATWTLDVPSAGSYQLYSRWTAHPNRATDAKFTVNHAAGSSQVTADMEQGGGNWNLLGSFTFNAGATTVSLTDQANGYVIADALMLLPPGAAPNTATWTPNVSAPGQYEVYARWTQNPNRATNATYTVTHASGSTSASVNQQANGGAWNLLGSFTLAPGTTHKVTLTDQANGYVIADAIRLVPVNVQAQMKLHFVHVDHLNTPRLIANDEGRTVWRWDRQEPFGVNAPDENPNAAGTFELPLRFPGQYFDQETGTRYNRFRDYDANVGRYIQSDPIGIGDGVNTYAYAQLRPLTHADESGLMSSVAGGLLIGGGFCLRSPACTIAIGTVGLTIGGTIGKVIGAQDKSANDCVEDICKILYAQLMDRMVEINKDLTNLTLTLISTQGRFTPQMLAFHQGLLIEIRQFNSDATRYNAVCVELGFPPVPLYFDGLASIR